MHFILAFLYLGYLFFDLLQPMGVKYNSYLYSMHPDWEKLNAPMNFSNDPLNLKKWLNLVTGAQIDYLCNICNKASDEESRSIGRHHIQNQ